MRTASPLPLPVDATRLAADGRESILRAARLLDTTPPDAVAVGRWTVRDLAAHLASLPQIYRRLLAGEPSPIPDLATMGDEVERLAAPLTSQPLVHLASRIREEWPPLFDDLGERDPHTPMDWHGGLTLPTGTVLAIVAGEAVVHGWDLAQAARRPWSVENTTARELFAGLLPLLPHYLDTEAVRGASATIEVRLRGGMAVVLRVHDQRLQIDVPDGSRRDCVLSADPVAFLLVAYGRTGPVGPALRGRLLAWGRRPWVALALTRWLRRP